MPSRGGSHSAGAVVLNMPLTLMVKPSSTTPASNTSPNSMHMGTSQAGHGMLFRSWASTTPMKLFATPARGQREPSNDKPF